VAGLGSWLLLRALRRRRFSLRGKNVLITGGSRGLGLVLARELHKEGARLIICARDQDELDRAFYDLAAAGAHVLAVPCDVTRPVQVEMMVDEVIKRWGRIDVLINNAGTISVGPVETMNLDDYRQAMDVHFWAAVYTIRAVLPHMRERREGRIVNIASIGGKLSLPHLVPYSASKFALVGLSEGLRSELAENGILVTTVCPGLLRTGSPRHAWFKGHHRAEYAWFKISDSLPLLSMSAERAAQQIIDACRSGAAEVVLSWPAKLAVMFHDLFPAWTADILSAINHLLPAPGGRTDEPVEGKASESFWTTSWLTELSNRAAQRNNEIGPDERRRRRPPPNGSKPPNN
jgi:NAD(P)-dependent dehydrogenase (short-subunit alcohol dehydrogenase family)